MYIDCITFPQKKALQISKVLRTSPLYPGLRRVRPPRTTPQDGPWSLDLYPAAGPQSLKSQGVVISHWETGHQRCFVDTLFSTMKRKNIWVHKLPSFYDGCQTVCKTNPWQLSFLRTFLWDCRQSCQTWQKLQYLQLFFHMTV